MVRRLSVYRRTGGVPVRPAPGAPLVPLALTALIAGCAASPQVPYAVQSPAPYATFAFAGTHPVVDAEEEHVVRVGLARDTASFGLARRWLEGGQWPPPGAVRPEDFCNALAVPPAMPTATVVLASTVFASPFRPGWDVLATRVTTPVGAGVRAPTDVRVIVDPHVDGTATGPLVESIARALQARTPGVPFARERRDVVPSLRAALASAAPGQELVIISDGAGLGGPEAQRVLLDAVAAARPNLHVTVVGVLGSGYDDAFLRALAQAGGGTYVLDDPRGALAHDALAEGLARSFERALEAAWLSIDLDPGVVARWRLVGHENLVPRGPERPPGRALAAGTTTTVFIELKRLEDRARVGSATLYDGGNVVGQLELGVQPATIRELADATRLYAAAIFAEKLRGSYWAQRVSWPSLIDATRAGPLAALVERAAALDAHATGAGLERPVSSPFPLPTR